MVQYHFPLDPLKNPWILEWLNSPIYTYVTLVISGVQIVIMPCLFSKYIYDLLHVKQETKVTKQTNDDHSLHVRYNGIHIYTLLCMLFAFFAGIITFGNNLNMFSNTCLSITITLNICWVIAKISVYNVTLLRLESVFWGTQYGPSKPFLIFMYILINTVFILCFILSFIYIESETHNAPGEPGWCLYIIPTFLIFFPAALDLFVTPITVILFVKPLKNIINAAHDEEQETNIKHLVTKYVLLSSIGVFSNVFSSIFFGVTDIILFNDLDILVNPICLCLMRSNRWDVYYFFCKCCHNAANSCLHETIKFPTIDSRKENQGNSSNDTDIATGNTTITIVESWYQDPVKPTALSTVTVTQLQDDDDDDVIQLEEEFDSQQTTTSELERGEFKRKYFIPP